MNRPWKTLDNTSEGVGACPQHQTMGPNYDYNAPNSVHNLPFDSLADFDPNFCTVVVKDRAKLTDLISSAPIRNCGLLLSDRFRDLLESFNLPTHRFYPVPMIHRGSKVSDYWWLHLPQPNLAIPPDASQNRAETIIEASPSIASLDLLRLYRPSRFAYCFVSNRLHAAIKTGGFSGIRFGTSRLFR